MSDGPREHHSHIHLPPGVGYDPRFMGGPHNYASHIELPPGLGYGPRLTGDNLRHYYHSHIQLPPCVGFGSRFMGGPLNYTSHVGMPPNTAFGGHAGAAAHTPRPETSSGRSERIFRSLRERQAYQHRERHQERRAMELFDTEDASDTDSEASGLDFDGRKVNHTVGWWKKWPGITSQQCNEVRDYVLSLHDVDFIPWAAKMLERGERFPNDDALSSVRDLRRNWCQHVEARAPAWGSEVHSRQQEADAAQADPSKARAESLATEVSSPTVISAHLSTPESRVATVVDGSHDGNSQQD